MKWLPSSPLPRFALGTLIAMPLTLALWWLAGRDYCILILEQGVRLATDGLMAERIVNIESQTGTWLITTSLSPYNNPLALVRIPIFPTRFTVSFPLFWGLVLATPGAARLKQLAVGTLLLLPVSVLMVVLLIQFRLGLYINHQPALTEVPQAPYVLALPYPAYLYYLMGVGRQLALLIFPTLAPLLLWGLFNRAFIRLLIFSSALMRLSRAAPPAAYRQR